MWIREVNFERYYQKKLLIFFPDFDLYCFFKDTIDEIQGFLYGNCDLFCQLKQ